MQAGCSLQSELRRVFLYLANLGRFASSIPDHVAASLVAHTAGVRSPASGIPDSHGVTGGVYKTRERIHRSMLICDY